MHSISLDEYIRERVYSKSETYTQREVIEAIQNLVLVECVTTLPTKNIRNNQLYLVLNNEGLPSEYNNRYDLYIYVDNKWEQIDSLEFDISNYYDKSNTDNLLNSKSDKGHGHDNVDVTNQLDGFIAWEQQKKLDTVEEGANKILMDTTPTQNSGNAITSGSVYSGLAGKAPKNHRSIGTSYGVSTAGYYGHSMAGSSMPLMDSGDGDIGTDDGLYARADHVHPTDTSRASTSVAVANVSAGLMSADDKAKLDSINVSDINQAISYYDGQVGLVIDDAINDTSTNPVQNKKIKEYVDVGLSGKLNTSDFITELNTLITSMKNL